MRNLAPTTLQFATLCGELHTLADLEARYLARRIQLQTEASCAILAARAKACHRDQRYAPRPRAGNGRYLSQAWLDRAESYTAADTAWFRSPIR